jgi:hypothetical protein
MPIVRQRLGKHIPEVKLSTIEEHPLLGNRSINMHSRQKKPVFSVGSVPRNYKRAQSEEWVEYKGVQRSAEEYKEYEGVRRSTREYGGVQRTSIGSQNNSIGVSSRKKMTVCQIVICEML